MRSSKVFIYLQTFDFGYSIERQIQRHEIDELAQIADFFYDVVAQR